MKRIVLIIGAGASHDLHPQFALGPELLQQISDRVTDRTSIHDRHVSKLLLKAGIDYSVCWDFVHHIDEYKRNAEYPSIDEFLNEVASYPEFKNTKEDFLNIGQFAIMLHILGYESVLLNRDGNSLRSDAWLNTLCDFIEKEKLLDESMPHSIDLKIITFNYDRNIEHYIYNYPKFAGKNLELVKFMQDSVIHVYGKIGNLEWQDSDNYFKYGESNDNVDKIFSQRDSIKIMFPDRLSSTGNEEAIKKLIYNEVTTFVCSFGFNFDYLNCKLLGFQNFDISYLATRARLIANVYPYNDDGFINRRQMAKKIRNTYHNSEITYYSCTDFLNYIFDQIKMS